MSKKKISDLVELLNDPLGKDAEAARIIELLRLYTCQGVISTTDAWYFFSMKGEVPPLTISVKDSPQKKAEKTRTRRILRALCRGKSKPLAYLKERTRTHLIEQSDGLCSYCKRQLFIHASATHIDHIFPKNPKTPNLLLRKMGRDLCFKLENMAIACIDCNTVKNNRTHIFDPNLHIYGDCLTYSILISNQYNITTYHPGAGERNAEIGRDIYSVFQLQRLECRKIFRYLENDRSLKRLESCIISSEDHEELTGKMREFYHLILDRRLEKLDKQF